jgi:hypothetical protein
LKIEQYALYDLCSPFSSISRFNLLEIELAGTRTRLRLPNIYCAEAASSHAGAAAYDLTVIALGAISYLYIRWKVNIFPNMWCMTK